MIKKVKEVQTVFVELEHAFGKLDYAALIKEVFDYAALNEVEILMFPGDNIHAECSWSLAQIMLLDPTEERYAHLLGWLLGRYPENDLIIAA